MDHDKDKEVSKNNEQTLQTPFFTPNDARSSKLSDKTLTQAIDNERDNFEKCYRWLEEHMPSSFFNEFKEKHLMTIAHNLIGFNLQRNFIQIHFSEGSIVLCLDTPQADLNILTHYSFFGIKNYLTFISDSPPPVENIGNNLLKICFIHFTTLYEDTTQSKELIKSSSKQELDEILLNVQKEHKNFTYDELINMLERINPHYLRHLSKSNLATSVNLLLKSKDRDHIQFKVENHNLEKPPYIHILFAWKGAGKYKFLHRIAKLVNNYNLVMKNVNSSYIDPFSGKSTLIMSIDLITEDGSKPWESINTNDFLQELATLKYVEDEDLIEEVFYKTKLIKGAFANLLRALKDLSHQFLVHSNFHLYSEENIQEAYCHHVELTIMLTQAFELKFHPQNHNLEEYNKIKEEFLTLVKKIDTGNTEFDLRRKNILKFTFYLIHHTDKTNFYRLNKTSFSFRLNPQIFKFLPTDYIDIFPSLPFAIFFIKGKGFLGFQIRFKDISRGGIRTIYPKSQEKASWEKHNIMLECYNLAYTQHKKNKDIPEGGAKGVIFVNPIEELALEMQIYQKELINAQVKEDISELLAKFIEEKRSMTLYQSQRSFFYSILNLVNFNNSSLKSKDIVDYYKKEEILFFGPDENMHNSMIQWLAKHSKLTGYKIGEAVISSKVQTGINHKEYGVTSLSVNVCMHKVLEHLGIDPFKDTFTIKISGGPDGDVAGNQIFNLFRYYPNTAKLLAITDISGTIYDPKGLDLNTLVEFFKNNKTIRHYPAEKLNEGGFLLDLETKKDRGDYSQKTLCYRATEKGLVEKWLVGYEMNHLYQNHLHQVKTDIFIPAGGRPRTLNFDNYTTFLDQANYPSSKAIIEGANLYLTPKARSELENLGVLIIKDSSANKGGVICSSLEILSNLILSDKEFIDNKDELMKQILEFIEKKAASEASLLLESHKQSKIPITKLSEEVSKKINHYKYEILNYLTTLDLTENLDTPLNKCLIDYTPEFFSKNYPERIIKNIPDMHKKAIISSFIASKLVYEKGLSWAPSVIDILPFIINYLQEHKS